MCFFIWLFSIIKTNKELQISYILLCFITHGFKSYGHSDDRLGHLTGKIPIAYGLLSVLSIYTFYRGWQAKSESGLIPL
jgi:hypothetical protein